MLEKLFSDPRILNIDIDRWICECILAAGCGVDSSLEVFVNLDVSVPPTPPTPLSPPRPFSLRPS